VAFGKYHGEEAHDRKSLKPLFSLEFESSLIFSDWADALVSSSRKASASWIAFSGEKLREISPGSIGSGSYNLQLDVITDNGQRGLLSTISRSAENGVACSWNGSLKISDDEANKLNEALKTQQEAPGQRASGIYSVSLQGERSGVRRQSPTATFGYSPGAEVMRRIVLILTASLPSLSAYRRTLMPQIGRVFLVFTMRA
jgi:hypothetical protein